MVSFPPLSDVMGRIIQSKDRDGIELNSSRAAQRCVLSRSAPVDRSRKPARTWRRKTKNENRNTADTKNSRSDRKKQRVHKSR